MLTLGNKLTLNSQPIYHFVNKYSIDFDGVDDVIVTDGADTVLQPTTYAFWCKSSTTGGNKGVFGHGGDRNGAFHFNEDGTRPLLWLNNSYYVYWVANTAQDDDKWHQWVVYLDLDITKCKLYCDGVLQTVSAIVGAGVSSPAAYTESLSIGGDKAASGSYFEGQIDEFAVFDRELKQDEITRMYNTYYTPNRVANGNFSQIGNEEVSNGDFSQIGSEEVINGDFATDTDWDKKNGSTISGGVGNVIANGDLGNTGANWSLNQDVGMIVGKSYKISFSARQTGGTGNFQVGQAYKIGFSQSITSSFENYTFIITPNDFSANTGKITIGGATVGNTFEVDNVSVKEVGQNWSLVGDFQIDGTKAFITSASQYSQCTQQSGVNFLTSGKSYKLEADITTSITNAFALRVTGGAIIPIATSDIVDGKYTAYFTMVQNGNFWFQTTGSYTGLNATIDNITVKEVGQNWTLIGTATISDGKAHINSPSGELAEIIQTGSLVIGRNYKLNCDLDKTSGDTQFVNGGTFILVDGLNTINFTATTTNVYFKRGAGSVVSSLDNVVVQELKSDATNLMLNAGAYQSANPLITSTKSMEFDGADDYLVSESPTIGTEFTVSAWINTSDISGSSGSYRAFFATGGYGSGTTFKIGIRDDNGKIEIWQGNAAKGTGTSNVGDGKWHLITYTKNSTQAKIYVDGVLETTTAYTTTLTFPYIYVGLGGSNSPIPDNGGYFNGLVTEFGVYDRTLTPLEIASLYNQGMPTNLLVNRNDYQSGNPTVFNTKQVDFDGADDRLVANSTLGSMTASVSLWFKRDTNPGVWEYLFDFRKSSGAGYIAVNSSSNIQATSGNYYIDGVYTSVVPVDNEWHQVVVTGISINIANQINFASRFTVNEFFQGNFSQAGIWNSTLTANEVSSLYNHGLPIDLNTNQAAYTSSSNLVGYWRMGSGTLDSYPVIADQTNATLGNSIWDGASGSETGWTNFGNNTHQTVGDALLITYVNSSSGVYIYLRDSSQLSTDLTVGKAYEISFDTKVTSGAVIWQTQNTTSYFANQTSSTSYINQKFTIVATSATDVFLFPRQINSAASVFIKNIKVQEVQGNPAIMTNQTASDIENGSPYANIVQQSDFANGDNWYEGTGCTISSGKAIWTSAPSGSGFTGNNLNAGICTVGKTYKVTFTIDSISEGALKIRKPFNSSVQYTSEGTYSETLVAAETDIYIQNQGTTTATIDNLIVEEVNTGLQGYWKMGDGTNDEYPYIFDQTNSALGVDTVVNGDFSNGLTGWVGNAQTTLSVSNEQLDIQSSSASSNYGTAFSANNFILGKKYLIKLTVVSCNVPSQIRVGTSDTDNIQYSDRIWSSGDIGIGSHQIIWTSTGTYYYLAIGGRNDVTTLVIDNVSVQELADGNDNFALMTNMVEGNITNQYPLTKIRNYYRMGDGILDGFPIIQDQTSPNLAHIPTTNLITYSEDLSVMQKVSLGTASAPVTTSNYATAPDGTQTATRVVFNLNGGTSTGDRSLLRQQIPSSLINFYSIYVKSTDGTEQTIIWHDGGEYSQTTVTNEWVRIFYDARINTVYAGIALRGGLGANTSDILAWGFQAEEQTQATAYLKSDGIAAVRKATTTNLLPYSEDFENAAWTKYKDGTGSIPVLTANNILSPDGLQNGTKIVYNAGSGTSGSDQSLITDSVSVPNNSIATVSIYLKGQNGGEQILLRGVAVSSYKLLTLTTEWQRFSTTENSGTTNDAIEFGIRQSVSGHGVINSSATIYAWGAQTEEQTQAETYAKTTGLPVTIDLFTENNYGTMTNMVAGDIVLDTPNNPA